MDPQLRRSWTYVMHAAAAMRDYGFCMNIKSMEKMTIAQERVLGTVFQHSPDGVKLKDIAREVNLSAGAVSQIIETLVRDELVERTSDPVDRRAVNIHISEKSRLIRDSVINVFDAMMESILAERTSGEREAFIAILRQIREKFSSTRESVRMHAGETLLKMEECK